MAINKVFTGPEKKEMRLQLLALMLANTNRSHVKKAPGLWHSFWQKTLKRDSMS